MIVARGDYGYNLTFTVKDASGTVYNLAGYTITLKVWKPGVPGLIVSGACAIVLASAGTCSYTVARGDFDEIGVYHAELELTASGVVESTNDFELQVEESP